MREGLNKSAFPREPTEKSSGDFRNLSLPLIMEARLIFRRRRYQVVGYADDVSGDITIIFLAILYMFIRIFLLHIHLLTVLRQCKSWYSYAFGFFQPAPGERSEEIPNELKAYR